MPASADSEGAAMNETPELHRPIDLTRKPAALARPALTFDVGLYEKHLEDSDLSDAEKQEFLETLWNLVVVFVDLGFGIHPVQQACGQIEDDCGAKPPDLLSSWDSTKSTNTEPARRDGGAERKET